MGKYKITVGMGSCGIAAGAKPVYDKLNKLILEKNHPEITLEETGCVGMCYKEPLVEVIDTETGQKTLYGGVTPEKVEKIFTEHIENNSVIRDWVVKSSKKDGSEENLFDKQYRIVLSRTGIINPESIQDYLNSNGYEALKKVMNSMSQTDVIEEIKKSGLRGRGGAGFPTGLKWEFANKAKGDKKYMVCNADEGDPGAFMDRSVLEGDPHSVIEGMVIGAYAIGANEGFIYCRAEYPLAIKRLNIAIEQAEKEGYLGNNILGTDFSFHLSIKQGAGAFVCGEETALIASIEGKRGMPRIRPPFPAQSGIWGKPTNINNVETLANIAWIIRNGADKFASLGTEKSKGTKVFSLSGKVKRTGLIEVPMGITLREIIFDIAGGIKEDKKFKAVQVGGPSGGCIPESLLDTPVDYDSLSATGAIMGSGGMVVMDEDTCMVSVAKYFLNFTQNESCGKCTFCRVGTKRMYETLDRITEGKGVPEDLDKLEELAYMTKESSLCGLGQTAPNPVLTTLKYFRDEYKAHIIDKKCPAKECKALIKYEIDPDKCKSCSICARNCPVNAISGEKGIPYVIDQSACIKCGNCLRVCPFGAVEVK
ncbi:NADH-quinone oxidoreductase subunit NuoF [candidate division TA06 bacterium]|uniref:NADH-quinone oxidoreductase subunit NuoF n=1 Tax=candidate division TA06 bacterium TaxID=2250710 RepID=A0A660SBM3_UNCT6|nr:MAG: NADH-quinone oxidoreductase subunit NuoF [candidate division TA06 bacterium]